MEVRRNDMLPPAVMPSEIPTLGGVTAIYGSSGPH